MNNTSEETKAYLIFQAAVALAAGALANPKITHAEAIHDSVSMANVIYQVTIGALPAATPNFLKPKPSVERDLGKLFAKAIEQTTEIEEMLAESPPPSEEGIPTAYSESLGVPAIAPDLSGKCRHGKLYVEPCPDCETGAPAKPAAAPGPIPVRATHCKHGLLLKETCVQCDEEPF